MPKRKNDGKFHSQNVEAAMAKKSGFRQGVPRVISWTGSVIPRALPPSILCTLVAVLVTCLYKLTDVKLSFQPQFISVVGFVVSLLLAYRTNTAYDRYWEGRRLWGQLVTVIKNMTRLIWVHVKLDKDQQNRDPTEFLVEKRTVINLLIGFAVATKYYLRRERPEKDLIDLLPGIESKIPRYDIVGDIKDEKYQPEETRTLFNLPLELTLYLSAYINTCIKDKSIDAPTQTQLLNSVAALTECLTGFERVLHTPIPWAYAIHLDQTVYLYCLSLGFQLVATLSWVTIPVVFFASMVMIGVARIGEEIENPFGHDPNDLDLDGYCCLLEEELRAMISHPPPNITNWVFTKENHPFGQDDITAAQALRLSVNEIQSRISQDYLPEKREETLERVEEEVTVKIEESPKT